MNFINGGIGWMAAVALLLASSASPAVRAQEVGPADRAHFPGSVSPDSLTLADAARMPRGWLSPAIRASPRPAPDGTLPRRKFGRRARPGFRRWA